MSELNANSVKPDLRRSAASDLDLHGFSMSLLWDARHKWVKQVLHDRNQPLILIQLKITHMYLVFVGSYTSKKHRNKTQIIKSSHAMGTFLCLYSIIMASILFCRSEIPSIKSIKDVHFTICLCVLNLLDEC